MNAETFVDQLRTQGEILRLASIDKNGWCNGRGLAMVIDRKESMAIMLENCGRASVTRIATGAIVKFRDKADTEPRIIGNPAYPNPAHAPHQ